MDETQNNGGQLTVLLGVLYSFRMKLVQSEIPRVEAGSKTSTVTLRVVGGDDNGSLKSGTVKYGHESHGTRT
jgi:hypothetical protein